MGTGLALALEDAAELGWHMEHQTYLPDIYHLFLLQRTLMAPG